MRSIAAISTVWLRLFLVLLAGNPLSCNSDGGNPPAPGDAAAAETGSGDALMTDGPVALDAALADGSSDGPAAPADGSGDGAPAPLDAASDGPLNDALTDAAPADVGQADALVASQAIDPATGGTLTHPAGLKLTVPPGAVTSAVTLQAREVDQATRAKLVAGLSKVSPLFAITPHGTTFLKPVKVSISLSNVGTAQYAAMHWDDEQAAKWTHIDGGQFVGGGAFEFEVDSLSVLAVRAQNCLDPYYQLIMANFGLQLAAARQCTAGALNQCGQPVWVPFPGSSTNCAYIGRFNAASAPAATAAGNYLMKKLAGDPCLDKGLASLKVSCPPGPDSAIFPWGHSDYCPAGGDPDSCMFMEPAKCVPVNSTGTDCPAALPPAAAVCDAFGFAPTAPRPPEHCGPPLVFCSSSTKGCFSSSGLNGDVGIVADDTGSNAVLDIRNNHVFAVVHESDGNTANTLETYGGGTGEWQLGPLTTGGGAGQPPLQTWSYTLHAVSLRQEVSPCSGAATIGHGYKSSTQVPVVTSPSSLKALAGELQMMDIPIWQKSKLAWGSYLYLSNNTVSCDIEVTYKHGYYSQTNGWTYTTHTITLFAGSRAGLGSRIDQSYVIVSATLK